MKQIVDSTCSEFKKAGCDVFEWSLGREDIKNIRKKQGGFQTTDDRWRQLLEDPAK